MIKELNETDDYFYTICFRKGKYEYFPTNSKTDGFLVKDRLFSFYLDDAILYKNKTYIFKLLEYKDLFESFTILKITNHSGMMQVAQDVTDSFIFNEKLNLI